MSPLGASHAKSPLREGRQAHRRSPLDTSLVEPPFQRKCVRIPLKELQIASWLGTGLGVHPLSSAGTLFGLPSTSSPEPQLCDHECPVSHIPIREEFQV